MVGFARRRTGSSTLADEIAAEVVEQAWRSLDGLDDPERFRPWLMRMTANRLVDRHRSDDRRRRREVLADATGRPLRRAEDPAEVVVRPDVDDIALRRALDRLGPDQQEVIMLRFHADLSPADAALALGISPSAAGVRLHRAIAALRAELAAPNGGDADD